MLKLLVLASLASSACCYAIYPFSLDVLYDPATYDLLRYSSRGTVQETWYFARACYLISVIVPCRANFRSIDDPCPGEGSEAIKNYEENIIINVKQGTTILGTGQYSGVASYGSMITVPITPANNGTKYVRVAPYVTPTFPVYAVEIILNTTGLYPWRERRTMSDTYILTSNSNLAGYTIGLAYSII